MSTIHARWAFLVSIGLFAGSLAGVVVGTSGIARADDAVQAVWKRQELTYTYQGFTTTYTCDGLQDKVRGILLALGANKDDLRISSNGCIANRPSPAPSLRIRVTMPVPATGDTGEAAGNSPAQGAEQASTSALPRKHKHATVSTVPFAATWKTVSLAPRPTGVLQIEAGDCELVEQLRDHLFPRLGVKVVKNNISCIPHQLSLGQPDLQVQALVQVKQPG